MESRPARTLDQLNLHVLQRHYPSVTSIISHAPIVTLYKWSGDDWAKTDTIGTIFICELTPSVLGASRYSVVVLNRRGLENFAWEIAEPDAIEYDGGVIMLKEADSAHGLFVFNEDGTSAEKADVKIWEEIMRCAQRAEETRVMAETLLKQYEENADGEGALAGQEEGLPESVEMGRQLSLRELFGKQREEDSAWSVKAHHSQASHNADYTIAQAAPQVASHPQYQQQQAPAQTQFAMNPDTEFFLGGRTFTPQMAAQQHAARLQQNQAQNQGQFGQPHL